MLHGDDLIDLPDKVLNEFAILEDRAQRAERQLERERRRVLELRDEVTVLRELVSEIEHLAKQLQERAQTVAREATEDATAIENRLRHLLVMQAR